MLQCDYQALDALLSPLAMAPMRYDMMWRDITFSGISWTAHYIILHHIILCIT
jgi:hypothetical protein